MFRRTRSREVLDQIDSGLRYYAGLGVFPLSVGVPYRVYAFLSRTRDGRRSRRRKNLTAYGVPVVSHTGDDVLFSFSERQFKARC